MPVDTQDVWNSGNLAEIEDYIATDYIRHDPGIPMQVRGPEGIKQLVHVFRDAFPDAHFEPQIIVGELDKVVVLFRVTGSHQGELMGMPATGKPVAITSIEIFRLADGKIAEQWSLSIVLGCFNNSAPCPRSIRVERDVQRATQSNRLLFLFGH
ncbi:MAG TPA: ester cyclase [Terrimicrobiaceae bacterium]